jgi:glycosyltransferase involved in cell wall biosynthesis
LKLAILTRSQEPFSQRIYRENIVRELIARGIEVLSFTEDNPIPSACDLVWEPGLAGSGLPPLSFKNTQQPIVATVHGAAPFTMKWYEIYPNLLQAFRGKIRKLRTLTAWQWFREKVSAVIAVSEFGAQEISNVFCLPQTMIYCIYHGIDHDVFHAHGEKPTTERAYLLHVSQYKPKKNVDRIFAAYANLSRDKRPDLVAVLPGYKGKKIGMKGVQLISEGLSSTELATWYRGGMGFVFPSLHESFGMPILEAMACGCPVITSSESACPEVAGDSALFVNPRSIDDITTSMKRLIEDDSLRQSLRQKGLARSQQFTWHKSAEEHLKVFEKVLAEN